MDEFESLNHAKWDCKYHIVFIPKCRRAVLYGKLRKYLGEMFRNLAQQKECRIEEGHLLGDHVHMLISIPPKYAVAPGGGFHQGEERDPSWGLSSNGTENRHKLVHASSTPAVCGSRSGLSSPLATVSGSVKA